MVWTIYFFDPYAITHLWHGASQADKPLPYVYAILIPFILFESLWVHIGSSAVI